MEFIVSILALLAERFLDLNSYLNRFNWFKAYLSFMQTFLEKAGLFVGWLGVACVVIPILVVVAIVYYILAPLAWGTIGFILALFILIYCLGPKDLYTTFEHYFIAVVREDDDKRKEALQDLVCIIPENKKEEPRALSQAVFTWFNSTVFTCVFWFLFLGPLAPVLYRLITEIHKYAHCKDSPFAPLLSASAQTMKIIEWIPVRIAALGFALVGDFHHCFTYWVNNVISSFDNNYKFLQESGMAALGITEEKDGSKDIAEIKSAIRLTDRTLILFLAVVALFILGAVIF